MKHGFVNGLACEYNESGASGGTSDDDKIRFITNVMEEFVKKLIPSN